MKFLAYNLYVPTFLLKSNLSQKATKTNISIPVCLLGIPYKYITDCNTKSCAYETCLNGNYVMEKHREITR